MPSLDSIIRAFDEMRVRIAQLERQKSPPLPILQAEHAAFQACELIIMGDLVGAETIAREAIALRKEAKR